MFRASFLRERRAILESLPSLLAVLLVELALFARAGLLDVLEARPAHTQDTLQPFALSERRTDAVFRRPYGHWDGLCGNGAVLERGRLGDGLLKGAERAPGIGLGLEDENTSRVVYPFKAQEVGVEMGHVGEYVRCGEMRDGGALNEDCIVTIRRAT